MLLAWKNVIRVRASKFLYTTLHTCTLYVYSHIFLIGRFDSFSVRFLTGRLRSNLDGSIGSSDIGSFGGQFSLPSFTSNPIGSFVDYPIVMILEADAEKRIPIHGLKTASNSNWASSQINSMSSKFDGKKPTLSIFCDSGLKPTSLSNQVFLPCSRWLRIGPNDCPTIPVFRRIISTLEEKFLRACCEKLDKGLDS